MCIRRKVISFSLLFLFPLAETWTCCWLSFYAFKKQTKRAVLQVVVDHQGLKDYESLNDLLVHCLCFPRSNWSFASGLSYDTTGGLGVSFVTVAQAVCKPSLWTKVSSSNRMKITLAYFCISIFLVYPFPVSYIQLHSILSYFGHVSYEELIRSFPPSHMRIFVEFSPLNFIVIVD